MAQSTPSASQSRAVTTQRTSTHWIEWARARGAPDRTVALALEVLVIARRCVAAAGGVVYWTQVPSEGIDMKGVRMESIPWCIAHDDAEASHRASADAIFGALTCEHGAAAYWVWLYKESPTDEIGSLVKTDTLTIEMVATAHPPTFRGLKTTRETDGSRRWPHWEPDDGTSTANRQAIANGPTVNQAKMLKHVVGLVADHVRAAGGMLTTHTSTAPEPDAHGHARFSLWAPTRDAWPVSLVYRATILEGIAPLVALRPDGDYALRTEIVWSRHQCRWEAMFRLYSLRVAPSGYQPSAHPFVVPSTGERVPMTQTFHMDSMVWARSGSAPTGVDPTELLVASTKEKLRKDHIESMTQLSGPYTGIQRLRRFEEILERGPQRPQRAQHSKRK